MKRRVKYAKDEWGLIERTMYERHDKGYCLRPEPCMCDEGRAALTSLREQMEALKQEVKDLEWADDNIRTEFARACDERDALREQMEDWKELADEYAVSFVNLRTQAKRQETESVANAMRSRIPTRFDEPEDERCPTCGSDDPEVFLGSCHDRQWTLLDPEKPNPDPWHQETETCECGRLKRHCKGPYPSRHQETESDVPNNPTDY